MITQKSPSIGMATHHLKDVFGVFGTATGCDPLTPDGTPARPDEAAYVGMMGACQELSTCQDHVQSG